MLGCVVVGIDLVSVVVWLDCFEVWVFNYILDSVSVIDIWLDSLIYL